MALMDAARAAVYLTEQHVPSIGPEVGKHLVHRDLIEGAK